MLPLETDPEILVRRIAAGDRSPRPSWSPATGRACSSCCGAGPRSGRPPRTSARRRCGWRSRRSARRGARARPVVGYLRSLAKNLSIQLYRRAGNRPERHEAPTPSWPLPDPGAGQLDRPAARARKVRCPPGARRAGLRTRPAGSLPLLHRRGRATEAICADLDLTQEHFYRVLHRARGRYRRLFEEHAPAV